MKVSVDEIGVTKIRQMEFFFGSQISDKSFVYFAPLDQNEGPEQRWVVIDEDGWRNESGYIMVYTTEEMKILYSSMKGAGGRPIKADKKVGYGFLVRSGKLRMKIRHGCPGCRRFWGDKTSEGQCGKCHRCYTCCGKESVPFSCASGYLKEEAKKRYARRRK